MVCSSTFLSCIGGIHILHVADNFYRRTLSTDEKKEYIAAVQCLTHTPAISGINGTVHRFEDHQAVHSDQTPAIHWVVGHLY